MEVGWQGHASLLVGAMAINPIPKLRQKIRLLRWMRNHPLRGGDLKSPVFRWLSWHIGSRLVPGPILVPFVNATVLAVRTEMDGLTLNVYGGLAEPHEMSLLAHFLRPSDMFIDVGANAGAFTVLAAATGARVVAFEPVPSIFQDLARNVVINSIAVDLHNIALGEKSCVLRMTPDEGSMNHVTEAEGIEIPVKTLDEVMNGRCPNAMKIDVEGFELEVLKGAMGALSNPALNIIVIEMGRLSERYGHSEGDVKSLLENHGLTEVSYNLRDRKLRPFTGSRDRNGIFVRDPEGVQKRIDGSKSYVCRGVEF